MACGSAKQLHACCRGPSYASRAAMSELALPPATPSQICMRVWAHLGVDGSRRLPACAHDMHVAVQQSGLRTDATRQCEHDKLLL